MHYEGYQLNGFVYIKDENSNGYESPIIKGDSQKLLISKREFSKKDEVALSVDGAQFNLKIDYIEFLISATKTNSVYSKKYPNPGKMTTLRGYPKVDLGGYDYDLEEITLSYFQNGSSKTLNMNGVFKEPIVYHPAKCKEKYSQFFEIYAEISDDYLSLFL